MYKVEHNFVYGWDDAGWTENEKPWRFRTKKAAQKEIDILLGDVKSAVKRGDMQEAYCRDDYRIVRAAE